MNKMSGVAFGVVLAATTVSLLHFPAAIAAQDKHGVSSTPPIKGSSKAAGNGAKNLYYRQIQDPSQNTNFGLTYSIELTRDGKVAVVDSRFPFRSGDQLKFHVQSNTDGFLYIAMKEGSKGDSALLFPADASGENNQIKAGEDIVVPAKGVLEFDNNPGTETVKLIFSDKKIDGGDLSKYGRSVIITPKQRDQTLSAEYLLEFAQPNGEKADFQSSQKASAFAAEPALTVVSTNLEKPLSVDLILKHEAGRGSGGTDLASSTSASDSTSSIASGGGNEGRGAFGVAGMQFPPPSAGSGSMSARFPSSSTSKKSGKADAIVTDKWALVVGISEFKDPRWNLMYPAKDAQDFANFLIKEGHFAPDHVKVLTNKSATRENILGAFGEDWLPANVKPGDIALVYVATHGTSSTQDSKHLNYLVAYDTDPKHPYSTGIQLQELVKSIKQRLNEDANRLILVLDTCHSGAAEPGAKGLAAPTFDITDLVQGTGQLIIASAGANQTAHDSRRYKNGIFTKHFMDGLRTNKKLSDAFNYTQNRVAEEAKTDFHNDQVPVIKDAEWSGADVVLTVPPSQPRRPTDDTKK